MTYFDTDAFPVYEMCLLFSSCTNTTECSSCTTEDMGCYDSCSSPFVGALGTNVLEILPNTKSEFQCKESCSFKSGCNWYTYYFANDTTLPLFCFLLSDWGDTVADCPTCSTGAVECKETRGCEFQLEGGNSQQLLLSEPGKEQSITVVSYGGRCTVRVLAVGGGGEGGNNAGGGSGYLNFFTAVLPPVTSEITARVGWGRDKSVVMIYGSTYSAAPGLDGLNGGSGYSGGGGSCSCDGGSNGLPGPNQWWSGGQGTGEDIAQYAFKNFSLSPGIGGEYVPSSLYSSGGGGGGVIVNGESPSHSESQGEGYGGGGSGDMYSEMGGLPGIIIMEIVE